MDNYGMEYGDEDDTGIYCEVCGKELTRKEVNTLYQSIYCDDCYDKEKQQDKLGE